MSRFIKRMLGGRLKMVTVRDTVKGYHKGHYKGAL